MPEPDRSKLDKALQQIEAARVTNILDLSQVYLGRSEFNRLLYDICSLTSLSSLNLRNNRIGHDGGIKLAKAIAAGKFSSLSNLDLCDNRIGADATIELAKAIATRNLSLLRRLDLEGNNIGPDAAIELAKAIAAGNLSSLTDLSLTINDIGPDAAIELARAIAKGNLPSLTDLSLGINDIGSDAAIELANAIAAGNLSSLRRLDLESSNIGPDAAIELAKAIAAGNLSSLTHLNLGGNSIGPDAAIKLAKAIAAGSLSSLTHLCLGNTYMAPDAGLELAKAIAAGNLSSLTELYLGNDIGPDAGLELAKAIAAGNLSSLTRLILGNNSIGPNGAIELAKAIAAGNLPSLTDLRLRNNNIGLPESEMHGATPRVLADRILAFHSGKAKPWREVKIALLGDGEVGKSMLRWRIAPLDGERSPGAPDRTRAWERRHVIYDVPSEPAPHTSSHTPNTTNDPITAHLFDFGGQKFLWGSHRLLLGVNRSVYTVVARADKPLDGPGNRILHWIRMVASMRAEIINAKLEDADRRGDPTGDERLREDAEKTTPWPPILVVITHARSLSAKRRPVFEQELQRLKAALGEFAAGFGHIPVHIVDLGANDPTAANDAETIRAAWGDLLITSRAIPELWTNSESPAFFKLRRILSEAFPEAHNEPAGSGTKPQSPIRRWITVQEYLEKFSDDLNDKELARQYLPILRDVGVVHWVGDARQVMPGHRVVNLIFNPAWTATPICEVLWSAPVGAGCVFPERAILDLLRRHATTAQDQDDDPAPLLLELMRDCRLVFAVEPSIAEGRTTSRFLVPDRLPDEDHPPMPAGSFALRWSPPFIADSIMPRVIGRLWPLHESQPTRQRMALRYPEHGTPTHPEARAEIVHVDGKIELRKIMGDAAAWAALMERARAAIGHELWPTREERGTDAEIHPPIQRPATSTTATDSPVTTPQVTGANFPSVSAEAKARTAKQIESLESRVKQIAHIGKGGILESELRSVLSKIRAVLDAFDAERPRANEARNACLLLVLHKGLVHKQPNELIDPTEAYCSDVLMWFWELEEETRGDLVGRKGKWRDADDPITEVSMHTGKTKGPSPAKTFQTSANEGFQVGDLHKLRVALRKSR